MPEQLQNYNYASTMPQVEQDWGVAISELDPSQRAIHPIEEIIASDEEALATARIYAHDGHVEYHDPEVNDGVPGDLLNIALTSEDIASKPGLAEQLGTKAFIFEGEARKLGLAKLFPEKEREVIETKAVQKVYNAFDREFSYMPKDCVDALENIQQVFEVKGREDAGFKIMNFSETPLTGPALRKLMNAVREMDQLTGGQSTEDVQIISILPETVPRWEKIDPEAAAAGAKRCYAFAMNGTVCLNEALLKKDEASKVYDDQEDDFSVGGTDIEVTAFHELTHIIETDLKKTGTVLPSEKFGWKHERWENSDLLNLSKTPEFVGETKNTSVYGQTDAGEDVAESAAAMFAGNAWGEKLDDVRKQAIADMYAQRHSGQEGPAYLSCTEIDLSRIVSDGKLGIQLKAPVVIKPIVTYTIERQQQTV